MKILNHLTDFLNEQFKAEESKETAYWQDQFVDHLLDVELIAQGPSTYDKKDLRDPIRNWIS